MNRDLALLLVCLVMGGLRPQGMMGQVFVYPWLGLLPGLALTSWLMPRETHAVRVTLGLALSPVLSTVAAWILIRSGLAVTSAAVIVSMAGWLGCAVTALRSRVARGPEREGVPGAVLAWATGLGVLLLFIPVINPYIFIRGDSWLHGGIVMELLERGFPPQDARMAGLQLNYVWFFNFFIALLTSIHRQDPFRFMTLFNTANGFSTVMLTAMITRRIWGGTRAPLASAVLLTLGLNAGSFVLWPLNLARMWTGEVTGFAEFVRLTHNIEFGTARIIYSLQAPFAEMVSFLDKLLVGTALNFGYMQMTFFLWALTRWVADREKSALLWLAMSAAAMMLFHSVVGLSVVPMVLTVLGLAWIAHDRCSWLPARGAIAAAIAAVLAGVAFTLPYVRSITSGWSPDKAGFNHHFIEFNTTLPWTLATACCFALVLLPRPLAECWRERRAPALLLAAFAAGMGIFACFVHLPEHNAVKFVFEFFTPCVILAAPAFADASSGLWRRRRPVAVALALLFLAPTALTVHGYLVDPTGKTRAELNPKKGEAGLYRWLSEDTPENAVLVDRGYRDLISVRARRQLFLGTDQPPERAAFPAPEMHRRQRIMTDLYGPLASCDSTVAGLRTLGRPVYVVYRPEDPLVIPEPWQRLIGAAPGSLVVYDFDGFHVVQLSARTGS